MIAIEQTCNNNVENIAPINIFTNTLFDSCRFNVIDGSKNEDTKFVASKSLYKNTIVKKFTINPTINNINCVDLSLKKKNIKKNITTKTMYLNITGRKSAVLICGFGGIIDIELVVLLII